MNLQILKGDPTPEELAALVTVLAARPTTSEPPAETGRASNWATYWRNARQPFHPGPGQWRASAHP
ncbi:acyl-CoA carboxylase subunit epsilon [Kribbella sp. NPDC058245]|uniref:acyl-CoA carboxylase subunit epsilon n=1 Tax=Kribbella sp. NPDC058245 TaxID=3346399 RepID=UPI0036ED1E9D